MTNDILLPVLAALIGAIPGLLALWSQKRKSAAEIKKLEANAVGSLTGTALSLVNELNELREKLNVQSEEIEKLRDKLNRMIRVMRELLIGVARLTEQIRRMGEQPVFVVPVYEGIDEIDDD